MKVEAREAEPPNHTARATVNVTLLDENDNSPKFTSSKYETKLFPNQTEDMLLVKVWSLEPGLTTPAMWKDVFFLMLHLVKFLSDTERSSEHVKTQVRLTL